MNDNTPETIQHVLRDASRRLADAGNDNPRLDARLLLAQALGVADRLHGRNEEPVDADARNRFERYMERRLAGEPVSRILGTREFWSLEFVIGPATLDPRPDSETLIDALLDAVPDKNRPLSILDIGTGTGCLLLAALTEYPNASGIGVDIDEDCIEIASLNAKKLSLSDRARMIRSEWAKDVTGPFDIVLSNPPYIPSGDISGLQPEVRLHDPMGALDGGPDGLEAYRNIAKTLNSQLRTDGLALLEFGAKQGSDVAGIMLAQGLRIRGFRDDLAHIQRCVIIEKAG